MYFADTLHYVIYAYDYDLDSGSINNRRAFVTVEPSAGVPDGLTVDSEGCVWCAFWGGAKITRFDPQGIEERVIPLPVTQPTSCCFGGKDLTDLYITSAWDGLTSVERRSQPWAGDIFMLPTAIKGIAEPKFMG
jgi:sugar lactone lactonase YvrE